MTQTNSTASTRVVDLAVGMPAALAAQLLGHLGAQITRIEPPAGDPFYDVYPAYRVWRAGATEASIADRDELLARADVCIVGGEDFPGLEWSIDPDQLAARYPRLVIVHIAGYATSDARSRPAVDLLVQARTGLVNEESPHRATLYAFPMPSYGAALIAVLGAQAALLEREQSGKGQIVRTSLQQGTALWTSGMWSAAERPDHAFKVGTPKGAKQPIFRCGDGKYLMLMFGTPGSLATLYRVLGIDVRVDPNDRNLPDMRRGIENYFCDRKLLEPAFAKRNRDELLAELWKGGVAADAVLQPGEVWSSEQASVNAVIATSKDGWRYMGNPLHSRAATPSSGSAKPSAPVSQRKGPLGGIRIIDLGSWVAGPFGAKLLGDLGADVIKVEALGGDPFRFMYKNFASVTRGKRSLAIDMKAPEGMQLVQRLCASADAITHNMRVGVAERLGIDPTSLRKLNPRLVTLHCSAYGASGPKALNSGWDPVLQPYCGHSVRGGGIGNDPHVYSVPIIDYGAGTLGAIALLAGIRNRRLNEGAVEFETNLLDVGSYLLSEAVQKPEGTFVGAPPLDADRAGFHPAERIYRTQDGSIAIAARTNAMAAALASALDVELGPRAGWGIEHAALIAKKLQLCTTAEWLDRLSRAEVWAERCSDDAWQSLTANASARDIGLVAERIDPHYGQMTGVGQLLQFERSALDRSLQPIPNTGGDSHAILAELGLDAAHIDALYERRIIA